MAISLLEIMYIEKYFSMYGVKINMGNRYMFYPSSMEIEIPRYSLEEDRNSEYVEKIYRKVIPVLKDNNIAITKLNIELFCILHEIGHYFDYLNNPDGFLSQDCINENEYNNSKLEKAADEFAIVNFPQVKELIKRL